MRKACFYVFVFGVFFVPSKPFFSALGFRESLKDGNERSDWLR